MADSFGRSEIVIEVTIMTCRQAAVSAFVLLIAANGLTLHSSPRIFNQILELP